MEIRDATGSGYGAKVTVENMLSAHATTNTEAHLVSQGHGLSFTWTIVPYNYAANDTIILLRNDATDKPLIITDILLESDTATDYIVHYTDGAAFTPAGTAVVGVNTNRTSSIAAEATCIADETANTQGNIMVRLHTIADVAQHVETNGTIILGYHDCVAVDLVTVGTMAYASIRGYYDPVSWD